VEAIDDDKGPHPLWWTLLLYVVIAALIAITAALFNGSFNSYVPVTLTSDRSGLVMEAGGKVKLHGVQVGRVRGIEGAQRPVRLTLDIDPDQIKYIPANVGAQIKATTAFGAKYVDLIYPEHPSPQRLAAGAVIKSSNVSTEVNTVFQSLVEVLKEIDPAKLNGILTALADGLRGQGQRIGEATTGANEVLLALNARSDKLRQDWHALKGFSDTYSAATGHIVSILDSLSTTASTVTEKSTDLDTLLLNVISLSDSGIRLLGPNKDNLVTAINSLEPTTALLLKYQPELTCLLVGAKTTLDTGFGTVTGGGNGKSAVFDAALLFGKDPYRYPENLPIIGAKGGPGGKPGCGALPDVAKNFPQRYLVTNSGWGTGLDMRPNPGIGFPGWANYFPVTRAVPEPPSIRYPGGPAPGPIPYPGAPPYGAPEYAPDGTPLYPGLPPAPPPGEPREPGPPPPGAEPFIPAAPASMQPTPQPAPPP
jgi:phospholipid/cholesterol/gamma-HCH transport system substrate-binding protein